MTPKAAVIPHGKQPGSGPGQLMFLAIDQVVTEANIRADLGDLTELAASIAARGVLEPITVHEGSILDDGKPVRRYFVDRGHRRLAAAKLAGLDAIPAIVDPDPATGAARSIDQLIENIQRADLNPLEEAAALRAILDAEPGLKQADLAEQLGRSAPWVSNALRLLELEPAVQERLAKGELSGAHGKAIASLPADQQRDIAKRIVEGSLSSHDVEREVSWRADRAAETEKKVKRSGKAIEKALRKLAESGLPLDTPYLLSVTYELDGPAVRAALAAAGWSGNLDTWRSEPRTKTGCDCRTVQISVNLDGTGVSEICADKAHLDALYAKADAAREERHVKEDAEKEALEAAVLAALNSNPPPPVISRLLLWTVNGYGMEHWASQHGQEGKGAWQALVDSPDELIHQEIARHLMYNIRSIGSGTVLPVGRVLKALTAAPDLAPPAPEPISAAEAAERVKVKRAARVAAAETT